MIFVTTGTQVPFDRFLKIIDRVAPQLNEEIVVQTVSHGFEPRNFTPRGFISPVEFNRLMQEARLIVAHAGMGTIITAMEMRKPIVVFPRIAAYGEMRNDHQLATCSHLGEMGYVYVAYDEETLTRLVTDPNLHPLHTVGHLASESLAQSLEEFIG